MNAAEVLQLSPPGRVPFHMTLICVKLANSSLQNAAPRVAYHERQTNGDNGDQNYDNPVLSSHGHSPPLRASARLSAASVRAARRADLSLVVHILWNSNTPDRVGVSKYALALIHKEPPLLYLEQGGFFA